MSKHICGACGKEFTDEAGYNGHVCEKTGVKASDPAHTNALTGGQSARVAEAAQARGAARAEKVAVE